MDIMCPFGDACALGDTCARSRANSTPTEVQRWFVKRPPKGKPGKCAAYSRLVLVKLLR